MLIRSATGKLDYDDVLSPRTKEVLNSKDVRTLDLYETDDVG